LEESKEEVKSRRVAIWLVKEWEMEIPNMEKCKDLVKIT